MDTIAPATSASTHRVSYTLVGHGSAHEGSGQESVGPAPVNDTLDERNTRPIVGTIAQTGQYMGYQPRTLVPAGVDGGTAAPSGSMQ